jgi:hypothetical protein
MSGGDIWKVIDRPVHDRAGTHISTDAIGVAMTKEI